MFDRSYRGSPDTGLPMEDWGYPTRVDSDSPCWACGAVEQDCTCAREMEAVDDLVSFFGSTDIMIVVRDYWEGGRY